MKYVDPFCQPYRDFESNAEPIQWQKDLSRWVNMKATFRKVEWKDYTRKHNITYDQTQLELFQ